MLTDIKRPQPTRIALHEVLGKADLYDYKGKEKFPLGQHSDQRSKKRTGKGQATKSLEKISC